jgi:hypothetical protein
MREVSASRGVIRETRVVPLGEPDTSNIMNRIERYFKKNADYESYGDFVAVMGTFGWLAVTHEVARTIRMTLDKRRAPMWIEFYDRVGSLIRIRPIDIRCLTESTVEQRAAERKLHRAKNEEEKADKQWDDEC